MNLDDKKKSFDEKIESLRQHQKSRSLPGGVPLAGGSPKTEMEQRLRDWEKALDERLEAHRTAWGREAPVAGRGAWQPPQGGKQPLEQHAARVEAALLEELGFDKRPRPVGFQLPMTFVRDEQELRRRLSQACGSDELPASAPLPGVLYLPGQGTLINAAAFQGEDAGTAASFAADLARERWGWGFLLEYTALGQQAGKEGLWPALVADRLGLPACKGGDVSRAKALRQLWRLTEAGWQDWVWQYVMFKSRQPAGKDCRINPRPGRLYELIARLMDIFPLNIGFEGGPNIRLRNLLEVFSFLFLDEGEVIPRAVNSVLGRLQENCGNPNPAFVKITGVVPSLWWGRIFYSMLEARVGILPTPYATLIACYKDGLDLGAARDGRELLKQAAENPRANPDTRLALLARLDARVKYDPPVMATAAWERLGLQGPDEYFNK